MPALPYSNLLFAFPAVACAPLAWLALRAAARVPQRRAAWRLIAAGAVLGLVSSVLVVAAAVLGAGADAGLYVGALSSLVLVAAAVGFARDAWRSARPVDAVDPLVLLSVLVAVTIDAVVVPGFRDGDGALSAIVVADLLAVGSVALATIGTLPRSAKAAVVAAFACVLVGDAEAAAESFGAFAEHDGLAGVFWGVASLAMALAAGVELRGRRPVPVERRHARLRAWTRVLLPLAAVCCFPAAAGVHAAVDGRWTTGPIVYYSAWSLATVVVAFLRQGGLLLENRRAVARERALRAEAQRRAAELEALTALATTMTQVIEEEPALRQGLDALRRAARASSGAVHLVDADGDLREAVADGAWSAEQAWAGVRAAHAVSTDHAAGRHVVRLPLPGRDRPLGVVTLVRPDGDAPFGAELELLRLLAGQLGLAVQHARDHRASLESAIRDPLTGLYNGRFFFEAFEKEVRRHERYGSSASYVVFDVDDFKAVNDALGHEGADDVLRRIAAIIEPHIRPSDSLARLGGGEFALLLPETGQMDALLAAERVRTAISRGAIVPGRQVTVSGGVASMPHDGTMREQLTRRAGAALRWAKRNGPNLCAVARETDADDAMPEIAEGMLVHLHAVVAGIDSAQLHTRDHSENVAAYAVAIAQAMGLDEERIVRLRRAAFLHDIGKIAVPDAVLSKPGKLTDEEYAQIKVHPVVGAHMLEHAGLHDEARWVRHHHERVDGRGYPDGAGGDALELEPRIIFVADSFEAMTSDRPYSHGMPVADAVAELRRCAGTQFDPRVVDALCRLIAEDRLAVLALRHGELS